MIECKNRSSCMYVPVRVREISSYFRKKTWIVNHSLLRQFALDIDMLLRNAYESISLAIEVKSKINNLPGGSWIFYFGRRWEKIRHLINIELSFVQFSFCQNKYYLC